jgi:hypothetical protein
MLRSMKAKLGGSSKRLDSSRPSDNTSSSATQTTLQATLQDDRTAPGSSGRVRDTPQAPDTPPVDNQKPPLPQLTPEDRARAYAGEPSIAARTPRATRPTLDARPARCRPPACRPPADRPPRRAAPLRPQSRCPASETCRHRNGRRCLCASCTYAATRSTSATLALTCARRRSSARRCWSWSTMSIRAPASSRSRSASRGGALRERSGRGRSVQRRPIRRGPQQRSPDWRRG